jgi:hypothetical protein
MSTRSIVLAVALIALGGEAAWAANPPYITPGTDPYVLGFRRGYRAIPFPVNEPYAPAKVPVYLYGYFGARSRHEPKRNQGFNDYIRDVRRGYVW